MFYCPGWQRIYGFNSLPLLFFGILQILKIPKSLSMNFSQPSRIKYSREIKISYARCQQLLLSATISRRLQVPWKFKWKKKRRRKKEEKKKGFKFLPPSSKVSNTLNTRSSFITQTRTVLRLCHLQLSHFVFIFLYLAQNYKCVWF